METRIVLLSAVLLSFLQQVANGANTYRGAVVEYNAVRGGGEDSRIQRNVENIKAYIKEAKKQRVDIIAFPEYSFWITATYSPVPDPADKISPCDSETFQTTELLKEMSCAAKNNKIYTLVNLLEKRTCKKGDPNCPKEGYYKYNTNVAFDRNGVVIARYSKFNLYNEPIAQKPKVVDPAFFDTDFGVRFGILTSFDIHFPIPGLKLIQENKITDFISPNYWFSELPYLTALQIHRGWAETNNVNLLVPGLNFPFTGTFGSGIYNGKKGHIVQTMPLTTTSKLLVADIPKLKKSSVMEFRKNVSTFSAIIPMNLPHSDIYEEKINFFPDQLNLFNSEVVKSGQIFQKPVCSKENFCCQFRVNYEGLRPESKNYSIRAMAYNGIRTFGGSFKAGTQVCGVALCNGPHIMNCTNFVKNAEGLFKVKEIQIMGDFKLKNSFQIPSTLVVTNKGQGLEPLLASSYKFMKTEKNNNMAVSLELKSPVTNFLAFGIWGRDFTKDK